LGNRISQFEKSYFPGSELYWLGFTDLGALASADTAGVLRVEDAAQAAWLPLLDSRAHARGRADCHYIVSVSQTEGEVRCVLCRGGRHPPTLPRPLPTALPLAPPLAGAASERGGLEGQAAILGLQARLVGQARDKTEETEDCLASVRNQEVACVMKLFALACRSDHESRAVEVPFSFSFS
jgi:chromosome transmission fidelity protein 4